MLLFIYFVICPLFSSSSFQFCLILVWTLITIVELSVVPVDLGLVFRYTTAFNGDLSTWITSQVTTMSYSTFATTTSSKYTMQKLLFFPFVWLFLPVYTHTLTRLTASFCLFFHFFLSFLLPLFNLVRFLFEHSSNCGIVWLCLLILDQCFRVLKYSTQISRRGICPKWMIWNTAVPFMAVRLQPPPPRNTQCKSCYSFLLFGCFYLFFYTHTDKIECFCLSLL